jgi:enterobactin synthetase component D
MRHPPAQSSDPHHIARIPFLATGETIAVASVAIGEPEHGVAEARAVTERREHELRSGLQPLPEPFPAPFPLPLHAKEIDLASTMPAHRRATFLAGRTALRSATRIAAPALDLPPLLSDHRGAPLLPNGVLGSISHKRTRAVAAALADARGHVGIDLEIRARVEDLDRPSIATRILTARELDDIRGLDRLAHRDATLLRFALKEAIYKAIDPIVQRYVGFTEVELDVRADGQVGVHLLLPEFAHVAPAVHAQWVIDDVWFIALARSHP